MAALQPALFWDSLHHVYRSPAICMSCLTAQSLDVMKGRIRSSHCARASSERPAHWKKGTELTCQLRARSSFWRASISLITASVLAVKWCGKSPSNAMCSPARMLPCAHKIVYCCILLACAVRCALPP